MRVYKSKTKNIAYFLYRIVSPVFDPIHFFDGLRGYMWYVRDLLVYKRMGVIQPLVGANMFPMLHDKTSHTPFDAHYFYQQLWVFEAVLKNRPRNHEDVASTYQLSGYLSKIVPTKFIDIRPIRTQLTNLNIIKGSILDIPLKSNSVQSLSCLHVAEHIGLGRYGDFLDVRGTEKACLELQRVLKKGGFLYFSVPIGKEKICFNAHRILSPTRVIKLFPRLKLVRFDAVNDHGDLKQNTHPHLYSSVSYGCGMYLFTK